MINRDGFNGFTLAEVLIALVVIGIIAAITLTTVMPNIQERVNSQRQANIVYKVTQATNLMKANGAMINGFKSTDAFVDELQKYLKIMKRCDSKHIADCWPTKTVKEADGKEYNISNAQTRADLGYANDKNNKNVAIVLADGAPLLLTYDSTKEGISMGELNQWYGIALPVGNGYSEFLEYSSTAMSNVGFIMDVNGNKGPNIESTDKKWKDIRSFNDAKLTSCKGIKSGSQCYTYYMKNSYSPINCYSRSASGFTAQQLQTFCESSTATSDYFAGARAKCATSGGDLPYWNKSKLGTGTEFCDALRAATKGGSTTDDFWLLNHSTGQVTTLRVGSSICVSGETASNANGWRSSTYRGVICVK